MESITIQILNPKVKSILNDLADLELISIKTQSKSEMIERILNSFEEVKAHEKDGKKLKNIVDVLNEL
ncbi:hypothetical protein [Algoriphagus aquimarinus]|uniref:Uncharacterized protein n=1 Tax=Algoriphagus aquimarinus TaxID=237018 RepID=A0A5C7AUY5_9BACT|nr:hypothetical protein [Algoriphagus aquimarinus]TXE12167.1 hypothetical protein ESV85_08975 [Algoriphagus aquimarinus]